jgi:hypothetical protein
VTGTSLEASSVADPGGWGFDDQAVQYAIHVLDHSGVLAPLEIWQTEERERLGRHAGGAPESFSARALWVAMILAASHGHPMLATTFTEILFRRISPAMRTELGVPDPPEPDDHLGWQARYRTVRYRLHGLLEVIDPSPLPKNRCLDPETFDTLVARRRRERKLSEEVLARRAERVGCRNSVRVGCENSIVWGAGPWGVDLIVASSGSQGPARRAGTPHGTTPSGVHDGRGRRQSLGAT